MCGRFVAASDPDGLVSFFMVDDRVDEQHPPSWNVAPTMPVRAVAEHEGRRVLVTFRWGLVPRWADDARVGSRMINARAETLADKPAFRESFSRRRCIIPVDGFYEWQRAPDGSRVPFFVRHRLGHPLALAGLWDTWRARPGGAPLRTCTIVTTRANDDIAELHDRMPVVLPPQTWEMWLDRSEHGTERLSALLRPADPRLLKLRPASPDVGNVRNDHPGLLRAGA